MITDLQSAFKRYHRDKTFLRVFTYKMVAEINWDRFGTKLRHCHPVYTQLTYQRTVAEFDNNNNNNNNKKICIAP